MSSATTIATLPRISAPDLRSLLLAQASDASTKIAVIDVRDDDHIGGHIHTSSHHPSSTLQAYMPTLVRKHAETPVVVFHCALSQIRGPSAALNYIRTRERMGYPTTIRDGADVKEGEDGKGDGENKEEGGKPKEQKVYVLHEGFVGWQAKYGLDPLLTENYNKELWEEGY